MKKAVHHLTRTTRFLLITATILVALLITTTRLLLPLVEDYRQELETEISRQVGKPVEIGALRAHLRGFYPELVLKEVAVLSADREMAVAQLREVRVGLALSTLLVDRVVRPLWITLIGAELTINREKDGSLSVHGLGSAGEKRAFPYWLFADGRFEVIESTLFWQNLMIDGPLIELQNVKASLLNDAGRHQIDLQAELPEEKGQSLAIKMDYRGDIALADRWQGKIYIEGEGIFPGKILEETPFDAFSVEKGRIDFKIWGEWREASIKLVLGDVNLSDSAVIWRGENRQKQEKLVLKSLQGLFRLQLNQKGWDLAATELIVTREGESRQQKESLTIDYSDDLVRVAGSYLNLAELREALLESSLLTAEQITQLSGMAPAGQLNDFLAIARIAENAIGESWFCGRFNRLKLEAWRKVPGVEHFEGRFCGTDQKGYIELGAGDAQLNLASLFRTPWQIRSSEGRIYWEKQEQRWRLFSDRFRVETPDIKTTTHFELFFEEGQPPFLDLQASFKEGVIANAGFYYPVRIMPKKVRHWLDRALVSGRVVSGGVLLHGALNAFPFRQNEGVFEVLFDVEKTKLDYQAGWPVLTDIGAEVRFYQDDLVITADRATLEGARVERADVSILGLRRAQWLNISGDVTGDVDQSIAFLKNSPLHNRVDALLNVVDVHGKNKIELAIDVPLRKSAGKAKVNGAAKLNDAGLRVHGIDLDVSAVNGILAFDEKGVEAKALRASVLNEPVTVDLVRRKSDTLLKAEGRVGIKALSRQFPMPIWPYLQGEAAYDLSLTIPMTSEKNLSTRLKVASDTKGIALKLPAPYGKKESESVDFSLLLPLKNGRKTKMSIRYGEAVRAGLLFSAPGEKSFNLLRGELRLDGGEPVLPNRGLRLAGQLERFDVGPWEAFQKAQADRNVAASQESDPLQELDLKFGQLVWGQNKFSNVGFHLERKKESWQGSVSSQFGAGLMRLPDNLEGRSPLVFELDRLIIPDEQKEKKEPLLSGEGFNPEQLPNLNISSKQLFWKGNDLGALRLTSERMAKGVRIKALQIDSNSDRLQFNGEWVVQAGGENITALRGHLKSDNIGALAERLSITEALKSAGGQVDFTMKWQGSPWDMQLETLNGQLGFKFEEGRLIDIEPGAGRLLGLLSLQTIKRRLSLDFSDIFSKGFSFDSVKASYNVVEGDAITDDFFLDGPAARIDIQGRMGLAKRDFDQTIVVTPRTTENLPVAGALIGGPVVGAVVFVAQKLIGKRVEKVTRSRYSLTGSWDRPELEPLGRDKPLTKRIFDRVWEGLSGQELSVDRSVK